MSYVCVALGVPGNILSVIIWLRRHVISKNSSALYLAVLAIDDLLFLVLDSFILPVSLLIFDYDSSWVIIDSIKIVRTITGVIEPLLVLSFSVERLIAISCPLLVRCMCLYSVATGLRQRSALSRIYLLLYCMP